MYQYYINNVLVLTLESTVFIHPQLRRNLASSRHIQKKVPIGCLFEDSRCVWTSDSLKRGHQGALLIMEVFVTKTCLLRSNCRPTTDTSDQVSRCREAWSGHHSEGPLLQSGLPLPGGLHPDSGFKLNRLYVPMYAEIKSDSGLNPRPNRRWGDQAYKTRRAVRSGCKVIAAGQP